MKAYFAAGCFWGIEQKFAAIAGVSATAVGYMGGDWPQPTYHQVCSGETGHAETVEVVFDPQQIGYDALLSHFWRMHDPTSRNFQGPDVGTQYRSAIFAVGKEQRLVAEQSRATEDAAARHPRPLVTEISVAGPFWRAEEYHQQYLAKQSRNSCPN